jgi:hypothetical protein
MLNRRSLITGLIGLGITAPAIIRASSLMPVKVMEPTLYSGQIAWTPAHSNSGLMTFAWSGHQSRQIYRADGITPVRGGDFKSGQTLLLVFNGRGWIAI